MSKHSQEGQETLSDKTLSLDRLLTSVIIDNIEQLAQMLLQNCRLSLRWMPEIQELARTMKAPLFKKIWISARLQFLG